MSGHERRPPTPDDITHLAKALDDHKVEYVMIGGAAMALHGFPRMTKDIDLFLPVDAQNNARLLDALAAVPNSKDALKRLSPKFMDQGYSTSFEGDIAIDILYVAADKTFNELRGHVERIEIDGVPVITLNVDGMLISKRTARESDVPDRLKLERLRDALYTAEQNRRLDDLPSLLAHSSAPVRFFAEMAATASIAGDETFPNWKQLEEQVLKAGSKHSEIDVCDLADVLCLHSPGAVHPSRQAAIRERAAGLASSRVERTHRKPTPR